MQEVPDKRINSEQGPERRGLASYDWRLSYRTSSTLIDGRPVDMLHDFYIPALTRATYYDRVAGYFRSSSLAAASQGFSSFVGRQGKMRLIVGADLETHDVQAILDGDAQRLVNCLNNELDQPECWPEGVNNGVTLLAWMVAQGYLEVKVALRRHALTGAALRLEDNQDGYVHEKWFILRDEFGQRLYGSGTLNESKTALMLNAENVDVHCDWWGGMEYQRTQQAAGDFEILWAGHHPCLPVYTLPQAVKENLIALAEGIKVPVELDGLPALVNDEPAVPAAMEILQFAVIKDAPRMPGGRLVGMNTAPVAPWPHQEIVARRLINGWPYSYLLCDEVGLGKTIEAGLAMRSLYLSGLARRILIAAPASLTRQWQREMASKMLLPFGRVRTVPDLAHDYIYPQTSIRAANAIYDPDLIIVSTGLIARQNHQESLMRAPKFDLALVDESHAARRRNPAAGARAHPDYGHLYSTLRNQMRKQARSMWLATATPMQIHPVEVSDLLALTNRVGAFQYDPILSQQYYNILGQLLEGRQVSDPEWLFLRRAVKAIERQDPICWHYISETVIPFNRRRVFERWLVDGHIPRGRDLALMLPTLFSAAPLSRVMMRHTRELLEVYRDKGQLTENLAHRHIRPLQPVVFTEGERAIYDDLEIYLAGLAEQIRTHGDRSSRQMISFLLSFFRLRFASSIYAFRATMERRLKKVDATLQHELALEMESLAAEESDLKELVFESVDESDLEAVESLLANRTPADLEWEHNYIKHLLEGLGRLEGEPASKMLRLLSILDERRDASSGRIRQTVVFTRFYDTLQDIVQQLRIKDSRMLIGTYSGEGGSCYHPDQEAMIGVTREEVKERFLAGEIDILVCTDAAAEGLNLQTADLLINFDLPWNPMKVEQRIGRIDRIGQRHKDIYVENLCYVESAEETVYGRLLARLQQASLIVGSQQLSLLPLDQEDFSRLAEHRMTLDELQRQVERKIREQQRFARSMQMEPEDLYNIYMRLKQQEEYASCPVSLADIWDSITESSYLASRGGQTLVHDQHLVYLLNGWDHMTQVTALTVARELYEEGWGETRPPLHFATYGDVAFESILEAVGSFPLPGCVQRLTVTVPGMPEVEIHAYAVAACKPDSVVEIRLITSYQDLKDMDLAEEYCLTESDILPLRQQFERMVQEEFNPISAAAAIERDNVRAAQAQEVINYLAGKDLLEVVSAQGGDNPGFWATIRDINSIVSERPQIIINNLPADILRNYQSAMFFDPTVPRLGDQASVTIPRIVLEAAIGAAERLADGERGRKRDLTVATMLRRLQAEADKRQREL
ncbi:MAG: helicase [Syntrophomonadaceae bacterium]|nr:helicase [Syntrophomonadaceae bacterium]